MFRLRHRQVRRSASCLAGALAPLAFSFSANATSLSWDANGTTAAGTGGTGVWDINYVGIVAQRLATGASKPGQTAVAMKAVFQEQPGRSRSTKALEARHRT